MMERGRRVGLAEGSPQWLAWRAAGITASDTAAILGLSPWTSAYDLWWRKAEARRALADGQTLTDDFDRSQRFAIGHAMEPLLHRFFAREVLPAGWRIGSGGCWQRRGAKDWMRATPDRCLYDRPGTRTPVGLLEFKTSASHDEFGDDPGDGLPEIPVHYRAQLVHQMLTVGVPQAWLTVLAPDMTIRHYRVHIQPDEYGITAVLAAFHRSIYDGQPPDVDGHDATTARIKDRWGPDLHDVDVTVDEDLAVEYHAAITARKAAQARENEVKNRLLNTIGTGRRAVTPDGVKVATRIVTWPKRSDAAAVKAALESLCPDFPFAPDILRAVSGAPSVQLRETPPPKPTPTPIGRTTT